MTEIKSIKINDISLELISDLPKLGEWYWIKKIRYSKNWLSAVDVQLPLAGYWKYIIFGKSIFIIQRTSNENSKEVLVSRDGLNWKICKLPKRGHWLPICYGNGLFVSTRPYDEFTIVSRDGLNWEEVPFPKNLSTIKFFNHELLEKTYWDRIISKEGKFFIYAKNDSCPTYYSLDGFFWERYWL